jgi:gas vesicle protein
MTKQSEEQMEGQEESANRLGWFLVGAIIGATVAIMYAPQSGKHTRKFLSRKTQEGKEAVAETGKDLMEAGREIFEHGRQLVEDAADLFERGRKLVRG